MKIYEDLLNLIEEFINELDDETVNSSNDKRKENSEKARDKYSKLCTDDNASKEEVEAAKKEYDDAWKKLVRNNNLVNKRDIRRAEAFAKFKEKFLNKKPQTYKETQQAASDHDNAIIDQYYRNKLEKAFENSSECFE